MCHATELWVPLPIYHSEIVDGANYGVDVALEIRTVLVVLNVEAEVVLHACCGHQLTSGFNRSLDVTAATNHSCACLRNREFNIVGAIVARVVVADDNSNVEGA